jgi:hypothetical protein
MAASLRPKGASLGINLAQLALNFEVFISKFAHTASAMRPRYTGGRHLSLPLDSYWSSEDEYVESLLTLVSTSQIFRNLCGGVHVLDFLTREPDLYSTVLPQDWRDWVEDVDVHDFLDLLLRSDLDQVRSGEKFAICPPNSLLEYIATVRKHCLIRSTCPKSSDLPHMPRHVSVGMKPKKIHEVSSFAAYVDDLAARVSNKLEKPVSLIDFGSGQNYLGRTLASLPYNRGVIAVERKHHNVECARGMDVHAKLAKKEKIMRNKKEYKQRLNAALENGLLTPSPEDAGAAVSETSSALDEQGATDPVCHGSMTYIEHDIRNGSLEDVLPQSETTSRYMTISLHSCGNLSHHAIRSLSLNPSVSAVAIIGCCYNLLTERLGPATRKHPSLRSNHPRLISTSTSYDPHGFPLSKRLESFSPPDSPEEGVRLNITSRMMAVQAPQNWGHDDSETFFTRHFYRALLQRIFFDNGVVKSAKPENVKIEGNSLTGKDKVGTPLIIGSLRKSAFTSFEVYVQAAMDKLLGTANEEDNDDGTKRKLLVLRDLLTSSLIGSYTTKYVHARKHLAIIWSLMAFSAGVVESVIAVDRWLFLKEQECVREAWVEPVFEYSWSPRNLCVVGIRKHAGSDG